MQDSRAMAPRPSAARPRPRTRNRARRVAAGVGVVAVLLGMVALTAPVAAQPFTYGSTEVLTGGLNDDTLSEHQTNVLLCRNVLDDLVMAATSPDSSVPEFGTNEDGVDTRTDTQTWTRGDANVVAGECEFVLVIYSIAEDIGGVRYWGAQSSTLTITKSWVMPDLSAAATPVYTYIDEGGNAIAGNFTVPEGNCEDDGSGDQYGIRLNSRPDNTVWITVLHGTEAGHDRDLWSPNSTTWTISPTEYDAGQTTRWIRVCAYPDSDSSDGTRSFHHLLNSTDDTFRGTTTLTVEEVDDD